MSDTVQHFALHRDGELGLRREVADRLRAEWAAEDAARSESERLASERAARKADRDRLLAAGREFYSRIEHARLDVQMSEERLDKESGADRIPLREAELQRDMDFLAESLDEWTRWKAEHQDVAVAVEELERQGVPAGPQPFAPPPFPRPNWQDIERERAATAAAEARRERERQKAEIRAEIERVNRR
jgi:hypothetical protein